MKHTKIKIKNKMKMKMRKSIGKRGKVENIRKETSRQDSSTCKGISCLNSLLKVLKINKDTVVNFIAQRNRMYRNLNTSGKVNDIIYITLFITLFFLFKQARW